MTTPMKRLKHTLTMQNLWIYVLAILSKHRIHAYGMSAEMKKRFGWSHGLITTYVVLYKLEAEGLISSIYEERRRYYSITPKGKKALAQAKEFLKKTANSL